MREHGRGECSMNRRDFLSMLSVSLVAKRVSMVIFLPSV
jgi:hypothetical protein